MIGFPIFKRAVRAASVKKDLEFLTTGETLNAVIVKSLLCSKVTNYHCLRLSGVRVDKTNNACVGKTHFQSVFGGDRPNQGREPKP
jgi:hypothetical protein